MQITIAHNLDVTGRFLEIPGADPQKDVYFISRLYMRETIFLIDI